MKRYSKTNHECAMIINYRQETSVNISKKNTLLFFVHHFLAEKIAIVNALVRNIASYLPDSKTKYKFNAIL